MARATGLKPVTYGLKIPTASAEVQAINVADTLGKCIALIFECRCRECQQFVQKIWPPCAGGIRKHDRPVLNIGRCRV